MVLTTSIPREFYFPQQSYKKTFLFEVMCPFDRETGVERDADDPKMSGNPNPNPTFPKKNLYNGKRYLSKDIQVAIFCYSVKKENDHQ